MNKSYQFLIGILILIALAIGGFAFYRSATRSNTPVKTKQAVVKKIPQITPTPPPLTEQEKMAKSNTLPLTITSPNNDTEITSATLIVSGLTSPDADVAINDKDIKADKNGNFTTTLNLETGENYILIVASNENGASEWEKTVNYSPSN